ncbi:hypothetical protein BDV24DRAFT_170320 [Aspergillus arachidicola]|uniref:Uncharacterized protein n=1 Tax=Aspergillus arachidicola TaxID=656916 RepID=A0A5N6XMA5_9EURO|nr:hypothetical protein BDV24DRAFT_170320 [Aspergillus arachidicola]
MQAYILGLVSDVPDQRSYPSVGLVKETKNDYDNSSSVVWCLRRNDLTGKLDVLQAKTAYHAATVPKDIGMNTTELHAPFQYCKGPDSIGVGRHNVHCDRSLGHNWELDQAAKALGRTLLMMYVPGVARRILEAVPDLETLHSTRLLNKTFYKAYQDNALSLIRAVLWRMSPPAWELREMGLPWAKPGTVKYSKMFDNERAPRPYRHPQHSNSSVVRRESSMHCMMRVCAFGPFAEFLAVEKDVRETRGGFQQEWLAGGARAHQPSGCGVLVWDQDSEVLNLAPESFAKGNHDGLSTSQTTMMLLTWNHLHLQLKWKVRRHFEAHSLKWNEGPVDEWITSILTLGLAAVDYILLSHDPISEAEQLGWAAAPTALVNQPEHAAFLRDACIRRLQRLSAPSIRKKPR